MFHDTPRCPDRSKSRRAKFERLRPARLWVLASAFALSAPAFGEAASAAEAPVVDALAVDMPAKRAAGESRRVPFSDQEKKRLEKGDVLVAVEKAEGSGVPIATVRALIDAAPEKVWPLIDRCDDYVGVMPRITKAEELDRKGQIVRCSIRFSPPWPLSDMTSITVAQHHVGPPAWSRTWDMESGDYNRNSGHWLLHAYEGDSKRTLVEYRLHSEPKVAVPGFLQEMGVKSALPDVIHQLRKAVAK